jgi:hypothetical protein
LTETLFPLEPLLTERQAFALAELERLGGLDDTELGARLHARKGKHADWQRCEWCSTDGRGVLKALRAKGLVRRRKDGCWLPLIIAVKGSESGSKRLDTTEAAYDPRTAVWPEGF